MIPDTMKNDTDHFYFTFLYIRDTEIIWLYNDLCVYAIHKSLENIVIMMIKCGF
jgi:hypothetical protein